MLPDSKKMIDCFADYLDIKVLESKEGHSKLSMPFKKEFTNPYGRLHGGSIMTLADSAVAVAVNSQHPNPFYTIKMNVKFRSSVNEGMIFAEAKLVGRKKNFVFGEVQVKSDKGELLAEVSSTFIVPKAKVGVGKN